MASFELPNMPKTPMSTALLVGAASPLWGFYGAAAAGGVAYWWMTRWGRPVNLEALFGAVAETAPMAMVAAVEEVVEAAAEAAVEAAESVLEAPGGPVGGESAPVSPLAAIPEPEVVADPAPAREDIEGGAVKAAVEAATGDGPTDASGEAKSKVKKTPPAKTDS